MESTLIGAASKRNKIRRLKLSFRHRRHPSSNVTTFYHYTLSAASSSEAKGRKSNLPVMQLMKYGVPTVLLLIELKYQGNTNSLFDENPVPLWCFITATFIYWLIVGAMKKINHQHIFLRLLRNAALAFALVSLISLVAMFLPYPSSLIPLALVILSLLSLALLYAFHMFLIGIQLIVNKIHSLSVWVRRADNLTAPSMA